MLRMLRPVARTSIREGRPCIDFEYPPLRDSLKNLHVTDKPRDQCPVAVDDLTGLEADSETAPDA